MKHLHFLAHLLLAHLALSQPISVLHDGGFELDEPFISEIIPGFTKAWGYDPVTRSTADQTVTPRTGSKMVKFEGSAPLGGSLHWNASQIVQLIDLQEIPDLLGGGPYEAKLTAYVNRVAGDQQTDTRFRIRIGLSDHPPAEVGGNTNITQLNQTISQNLDSDSDPMTWEPVTVSIPISETTRTIFVEIAAVENIQNDASYPEFDGHYADDVTLEIRPAPPTITHVNPANPPALDTPQTFTIHGTNFHPDCTVTLRDHRIGEVFGNREREVTSSTSIELTPNFTAANARWSVSVSNGAEPSNEYPFWVGEIPTYGTLVAQINNAQGIGVSGASVKISRHGKVEWEGVSDSTGNFSTPLFPPLPHFVEINHPEHPAYIGVIRVKEGGIEETFTLPDWRQFIQNTVDRTPLPASTSPPPTPPSSLLVLGADGTATSVDSGGTINADYPTVVLSHGWNSSPSAWPIPMGRRIRHAVGPGTNILIWDWEESADEGLWGLVDRAVRQGRNLGEALTRSNALGKEYSNHVHFIGHSAGTLVNRYACDRVHGSGTYRRTFPTGEFWDARETQPHVTLLDEAEIASVAGKWTILTTVAGAVLAGKVGAEVALSATWKDPVPHEYSWIDNYISSVGFYRPEANNVLLYSNLISHELKLSNILPVPDALLPPFFGESHSWAIQWYRQTVETTSTQGFGWSVANLGSWPPEAVSLRPGSEWYQDLRPDSQGLIQTRDGIPFLYRNLSMSIPVLDALDVQVGGTIIQTAADTGNLILDTSGNIAVGIKNHTGQFIDRTFDNVADWARNLPPESQKAPLSHQHHSILLGSSISAAPPNLDKESSRSSNFSATDVSDLDAAWFSITVPVGAEFFLFDVKRTGSNEESTFSVALNDVNVFHISSFLLPSTSFETCTMIDVRHLQGEVVEIQVASENSGDEVLIEVEGFRFMTGLQPELRLTRSADGPIIIDWPVEFSGWSLETSANLQADSWVPATDGTELLNRGKIERLAEPGAAGGRAFFRLRSPENP